MEIRDEGSPIPVIGAGEDMEPQSKEGKTHN